MAVDLDFQDAKESEDLLLQNGTATVTHTRPNLVARVTGLTPHRTGGGGGWLCSLPSVAGPEDVVQFMFTHRLS